MHINHVALAFLAHAEKGDIIALKQGLINMTIKVITINFKNTTDI
jgi:hypothetical protein